MSRMPRHAGIGAWVLWLAACTVPPQEPPVPEPPSTAARAVVVPVGPAVPRAGSVPVEPSPAPEPVPSRAEPELSDGTWLGQGLASWYGRRFHGRRTASGERFDRFAFTAAHRTLPFGTHVCVRSLATGEAVVVRINDRGPFGSDERVVDLSQAAARALGMIGLGVKPVELWQTDEDGTDCVPALGDGAARAAAPGGR